MTALYYCCLAMVRKARAALFVLAHVLTIHAHHRRVIETPLALDQRSVALGSLLEARQPRLCLVRLQVGTAGEVRQDISHRVVDEGLRD